MAKQSGRRRGAGAPSSKGRGQKSPASAQGKRQQKAPKPQKPRPEQDATPAVDLTPRTFRLGAVPGATPGRWIDTWQQRMPHVALELVPITVATQRDELAGVDAALLRTPLEQASDLHVIPLYDELAVVVASADSHLLAADELTADDLEGEVLLTPGDDVLGPLDLPTVAPAFEPIATTEDAIATVASGVGIVVVPMSLARLYRRKDVDYRVLRDGPLSPVALVWPRDRSTPDIETFVGIVRGRTANSSR